MLGVGFAWASILSLPYAMPSDSVPAAKMGTYMGIFNFHVIPQLSPCLLGFLLKTLLGGHPIHALAIGGASMIVAGLCVLRVRLPAEKPHEDCRCAVRLPSPSLPAACLPPAPLLHRATTCKPPGTTTARWNPASQAVYFVMTDRTVNGDPANDQRDQGGALHTFNIPLPPCNGVSGNIGYMGGDFKGIADHLTTSTQWASPRYGITPIVDNPDESFTGGVAPTCKASA